MPTRQQKEQMVAEVKGKMQNAQVVILSNYRGITVDKITALREKMRKAGCEMKVAKNTLTKIAANELGIDGLDPYLQGPTILTFGNEDPVAAAKILNDFSKEVKKGLEIKVGVLEGKVVSTEEIKALADLPSREVLLAKVLGGMQAPMYGFAGVLSANLRNLVYVLEAIRKQKEETAS
ncbi:50S ribosomal protein L10 [Desulfofalx alkaliphila]|uniref:50S ribosomal protein L10 n=1 Tax=Desulfofalx alkaliphila TaxID=105483 RepID=UPI0004E1D425|nr:50S ribosomal protein L10 [Desulfofalx alkaliphila]